MLSYYYYYMTSLIQSQSLSSSSSSDESSPPTFARTAASLRWSADAIELLSAAVNDPAFSISSLGTCFSDPSILNFVIALIKLPRASGGREGMVDARSRASLRPDFWNPPMAASKSERPPGGGEGSDALGSGVPDFSSFAERSNEGSTPSFSISILTAPSGIPTFSIVLYLPSSGMLRARETFA